MRNSESGELIDHLYSQEGNQPSLERFIQHGLEMMSNVDYEGAIVYFRNGVFTANPGFDVVIRSGSVSQVQDYDSFQESLRLSNMESSFSSSQMRVREFGDIALLRGFFFNSRSDNIENLRSAAQRAQLQAYHVVSLNYAEVWLNMLYYLQRGETRADFEAQVEREAYIGSYLGEHRVPLDFIWSSRHQHATSAYNRVIER